MAKIYVGVTSYTGQVDSATACSLLANVRDLEKNGHTVDLKFEIGDCYIANARNKLAEKFIKSEYDFLVFVDSDLGFDNDAIRKLISYNRDVCAGAYPFKMGVEGFPVNININPNRTPLVDDDGLISAIHAPTGLMSIKKDAFTKMIDQHPEWKCSNDYYCFFDTGMVFNGDNKWYGEDVAFCHRVLECGLKVWIAPDITFEHIGRIGRTGNYHEFLIKQPQPEVKK